MDDKGVEDAAILLMSLGEEEAAEVFKHLEPKEVQHLGEAIARMKAVTKERIGNVLDRFAKESTEMGVLVADNDEYIKAVLRKALGDDKANLLIDRIIQGSDVTGIESLKWMDAGSVAELLRNEHPQIVAAILVHLDPDQSSSVLKFFPERQRNEVMVRIAVTHPMKQALEIFAREIVPSGTSWSPGTTGPSSGRPSASPNIKPLSLLVKKSDVPVSVVVDGQSHPAIIAPGTGSAEPPAPLAPAGWDDPAGPQVEVPLVRLAWARSGDKGDISNIGIIARDPAWMSLIWARLTPEVVKAYFAHLVQGKVRRFYLPGIHALNITMNDALDGGGPASSRMDPLGKGMGQMLLDLPVAIPAALARQLD